MNADPINWMLLVMILFVASLCLVAWSQPGTLRKLSARCLARADALDQSHSAYEKSLRHWNKQLRIPEPKRSTPSPALEARSNDV